ncbi:AAA family ATPase [Agrobacterium larrymoorei]|uniref:AAA family ATPase n=1 Tax=Agrobacterium larrymoorei TaxID=160699 RepID=A0AAF0HB87_9HYPH|nr:AAA family ATPase [Agrobacterium larrymoorei]WHA43276.1 AAA family ATPase [Agrobacterium larrymoorei]
MISDWFNNPRERPSSNRTGKPLAPWKGDQSKTEEALTVPVFMAFCGLAAALRPWNRIGSKFIVIICLSDDDALETYKRAARIFLDRVANKLGARLIVNTWGKKNSFRDQQEALDNDRSISIKEPAVELDDDAELFADAVVHVMPRCRRHAKAALRRCGIPPNDEHVELLLTESWSRLASAFQDRRSPLLAIQRLKQIPRSGVRSSEKIIGDPNPTLADLSGFGMAADWGCNLAIDLADYKAGKIDWDDVDPGVLLSGPPGSGKTMFVKALGSTCRVPVIYGSPAAWQEAGSLDAHLKAMRNSFDEAKSAAPALLFIDEVDTLGTRGSKDNNQLYGRAVITAFLELLDGFDRRSGVVVVAACNHPQHLDPAIKRAGRLDRHLEISLPDSESRLSILRHYSEVDFDERHFEMLSLASDGLSGADIKRIVRDAKRSARRRNETLTSDHILEHMPALLRLPEEYIKAVAVHEAGHAIVAAEVGLPVGDIRLSSHKVDGHQMSTLGEVSYSHSMFTRRTRAHYIDQLCVCLAGMAAEIEIFGSFADFSAGSDLADLSVATRIATLLEGALGMGETLIVESMTPDRLETLRDNNPELRRQADATIAASFERTKIIIRDNRRALDAIIEELIETRLMSGDELRKILAREAGQKADLSETS